MNIQTLPTRTPFFYGWVVVGCAVCATIARQAAAVATLSIFIVPMTFEFGWSRLEMSGAVSLGAILGALVSPVLGPVVDRHGARAVLTVSALVVCACSVALAGTSSLLWFYVAFGISRLMFSAPFDLGITASVANWFVARRAQAMSYCAVAIGVGLATMPFIAQLGINAAGWRHSWLVIAGIVLALGAVPVGLFMRRRPEDFGLQPDGAAAVPASTEQGVESPAIDEAAFTAREATRTPAFWMLLLFTALVFPVQAGMSLHQAPHLVEQGLSPTVAATVVSTFSIAVAASSLLSGFIGRIPLRFGMALGAGSIALSALAMRAVDGPLLGYASAVLFGLGIGAVLTLLPLAWANYFGRRHFGTIRGYVLPVQVGAQAAGPLIAGALRDAGGDYRFALATFALLALLAGVAVLFARPPTAS